MRFIFLNFCILLYCCSFSFSQSCLPQGIRFKTQSEINSFPADYPNCTIIESDLEVGVSTLPGNNNPPLKNLLAFSQLTEIKGDLIINSFTNIVDFKGFENLTKIGGNLYVGDGFQMNSFEGLNSLDSIMGYLYIKKSEITVLNQLLSLKYIGGSIIIDNAPVTDLSIPNLNHIGGLRLNDCFMLEELSGFHNITEMNNLVFDGVNNLSVITGFTSLTKIRNELSFQGQHSLSDVGGISSIDSVGNLRFLSVTPEIPTFPNITEVGDLVYDDNNQLDLTELPKLDTIHNNLDIINNYYVKNILWGQNIKAIKGGLRISNNKNLERIEGLENVDSLKDLTIIENPKFLSLRGYDNYTSLRNVTIDNSVDHILGLQNLQVVENLDLELSIVLETIDGFRNLKTIQNDARITSNKYKGMRAFDELEEIGNDFYFARNTADNTNEEANILPNLTTIGGSFVLESINRLSDFKNLETIAESLSFLNCRVENFDGFEKLAPVQSISIDESNVTSYTNLASFANDSTSLRITNLRGNENLDGLESLSALRSLSLVENNDLKSVSGLSGLVRINDFVWIDDNDNLNSLAPMISLKTIGDIYFRDTDINFFPTGIETITGRIDIRDNQSIQHLDGLESLRYLGDGIEFRNNPALLNMNGFKNLEYFAGQIYISSNDNLHDISGLGSIPDASLISSLRIRFNDALDECTLDIFCEYFQLLDKEIDILGNGTNCKEDEIFCPKYSISGYIYYDENENGIKDVNEKGLSYGRATDRIRGNSKNADEDGFYQFYAFVDSSYTIDYQFGFSMKDNWQLTSDSSYTLTFEVGNPINGKIDFGFTPTYITNTCSSSSNFKLNSQNEIDAIPYEYPWCNVLNSNLIIEEDEIGNILDLTPLEQLSYINGEVKINDNENLESLIGLHNIQYINDDLSIEEMTNLKDLGGISQLKGVNGRLNIKRNEKLKDLYGIANLNHEDVSYLIVTWNESLAICDVPFVCKYISANPDTYIFNNNEPECNDVEFVGCLDQFVGGKVFYDTNGNKIQDVNDFGVPRFPVNVNGNTLLTTQLGNYYVYGEMNESYQMSIEFQPEFELTTDSASYLEIYEMGVSSTDHNFGLRFKEEFFSTMLNLTSGNTRCSEIINFSPVVVNEGSPIIDARLELELDPKTQLVGYIEAPSGLDTLNNTYWWEMDTLHTFQTIAQTLKIKMPDFNAQGEILDFTLSLFRENNEIPINSYNYMSEVRCAYDPNDKRVLPMGLGNENYTLFDDSLLTYTIRFQNTGNDYARNIRITDTLSEQLDLTTFRVLNSSFPVLTSIDGRNIEFSFRDIYLPDSTNNEPGSHGFVTYEIETLSNLLEEQAIENEAHIYFDFNPPIVTNTTKNTMVSMYPEILSVSNKNLDVRLKPNPAQNYFEIINNSKDQIRELQVLNHQGVLITAIRNAEQVDVSALSSGFYLVKIVFDKEVISIPLIKL